MKKKKIAVFSTAWSGEILYKYLVGLRDGLSSVPADIYLFTCHAVFDVNEEHRKGELGIYSLPVMKDFDAALLFANGLDYSDVVEKLSQECIDAKVPLIYTGKEDERFYFVGSDNYVGTRELTEHLINKHGIKDVWFIAGSEENMDSNIRMKAVSDVMKEHDLALEESNIFYSKWSPFLACSYVFNRIGKGDSLPDAIVCANDTLAMTICSELRKKGYKVPENVIVTGFDNEFYAQVYDPAICSVDQRFDNIGRQCASMLLDIFKGIKIQHKYAIPAEFVPSESCGCFAAKDFNAIRRRIGREKFDEKLHNSQFEIKLSDIERVILKTNDYMKLGECLSALSDSTNYEGDTFHVVMDPLFEKTIVDQQTSLRIGEYPKKMHVVFSKEKGVIETNVMINTRDLFPVSDNEENRFFIISPLHDNEYSFGYLVFGDDIDKLKESPLLRKYCERINIVFSRFYQNMRMDVLNRQLFQMTETDAMTHVKNRTAFVAKQEELQRSIRAGMNPEFAIVVFDVNNLKRINDNLGHEAGDEYIMNSCRLICRTFKKSAVYRIGGDEFVAVLQNEDFVNKEKLLEKMKKKMDELQKSDVSECEKVSVASGISIYDSQEDEDVADVVNRADALMYENKAFMKKNNLRR